MLLDFRVLKIRKATYIPKCFLNKMFKLDHRISKRTDSTSKPTDTISKPTDRQNEIFSKVSFEKSFSENKKEQIGGDQCVKNFFPKTPVPFQKEHETFLTKNLIESETTKTDSIVS